jgi:hypothetical protein
MRASVVMWAVAVAWALGACSSNSGSSAPSTSASGAASTTTRGGAGPSTTANAPVTVSDNPFCTEYFAVINSLTGSTFTPEGWEALKERFAQLASSAPQEISDDMQALQQELTTASNPTELPDTSPAQTAVGNYVRANCASATATTSS